MSKTVTYAEFDLISVETDGKKLKVSYYDKQRGNIEENPKGFDVPHPDLIEALKDPIGREVMATSLCLLEGWDFAREHNRNNDEALSKARVMHTNEINRCEVTKLFFTGEDESEGIKFKGKLDCDGAKVPLETPQFVFIEADSELAERAKEYAEKVKKEVWNYLFKGKKSQQSLNLDESKEDEGSKPKGGLNVA